MGRVEQAGAQQEPARRIELLLALVSTTGSLAYGAIDLQQHRLYHLAGATVAPQRLQSVDQGGQEADKFWWRVLCPGLGFRHFDLFDSGCCGQSGKPFSRNRRYFLTPPLPRQATGG